MDRFQIALDLAQAGEDLLRQNLRRRLPSASPVEIEAHVVAWLRDRPGAESGDAQGRPVAFPRNALQ